MISQKKRKIPAIKFSMLLAAIACTLVCTITLKQQSLAQHEQFVAELTKYQRPADFVLEGESSDSGVYGAGEARLKRFWALWRQRDQYDIGPELAPLVNDKFADIRWNALRAFALLEHPAGEKPIRELIRNTERDKRPQSEWLRKKLSTIGRYALGRIRSRDLKGQAKINTVLQSVGISWDEAVAISQKVNDKFDRDKKSTTGYQIIWNLVEVLHDMAIKGESIKPLTNQLTLIYEQKLILEGAEVSASHEADLLLDYAFHLHAVPADAERLFTQHFPLIGKEANDKLFVTMQDVLAHPERYPDTSHASRRRALMMAAGATGETRFLPLMKDFEKSPNGSIKYVAIQQRSLFEQRLKRGIADPL